MTDTTIKKVEGGSSPKGEMGQRYLVAGKRVSMRLWIDEPGGKLKAPTSREYETVGYVISGSARLRLRRTNAKSQKWGLVARPSGSPAPIHDHRAVHGGGGHVSSRRGPWSR